jgi:hypothetical protein
VRAEAGAQGLTLIAADAVASGHLDLPPAVASGLAEDAAALRLRATALRLEAARIGRTVAPGPHAPILLKGPAVARRWTRPELRPFGDLDALVPEAALGEWRRALEAAGYTGPSAWEERSVRGFHHHLGFRRPGPGGTLLVEVHWRLFAAKGIRDLRYDELAGRAAPSPSAPGWLELDDGAQLLALCAHWVHHWAPERRLVWLRDLIELGTAETVRSARELAQSRGLEWIVENALASAEAVLRDPRWEARPVRPPGGLPAVNERGASGVRAQLGLLRELGPLRGARHVLSRLDPRRFRPG